MPHENRPDETPAATGRRLIDLARAFLKLGTIGFGGPAAHVGLMEQEVVRRRGWLSHEELLDLLGAVNLIPGPNSTELAIHIGYRRAGWAGLIVAGSCFILPAAVIVLVCAFLYVRFGTMPQLAGVLYGVKPVVIAIVAQALWNLGRKALKTALLAVFGGAGLALTLLGLHELLVLFGIGVLVTVIQAAAGRLRGRAPSTTRCVVPVALAWSVRRRVALLLGVGGAAAGGAKAVALWPLFLFFAKVGAVLFGSGYVLLAFLRADLVERWQWMSESQLLDAIAVGQVTPGPVFTTATFIGYMLFADAGPVAGVVGAVVATAGIFLPAFCFVALSGPLVPRLRESRLAAAFLDGVNVASLALMAAVTIHLARAAVVDWLTAGLAAVSLLVLVRLRVNSVWLVLAGAVVGLVAA